MKFIVYSESGKILRTVICSATDAHAQAGAGEFFVEGEADDALQYISNGRVVDMPSKPSKFHQFDYTTKKWIDPRTPQDFIDANRAKRNALLLASDWTQLPDVPAVTQLAWSAYRQALRDITKQPDQRNVVWPAAPA